MHASHVFQYNYNIHVHQHYLLGIQVSTPDGLKVCRATLLLISVDLPAQSKMLNMKQYNGSYACNHCEDEGVPRPSSHLHRNWPYSPTSIIRTHSSMIENAKDTLNNNKPVRKLDTHQTACILTSITCCRLWASRVLLLFVSTAHSTFPRVSRLMTYTSYSWEASMIF